MNHHDRYISLLDDFADDRLTVAERSAVSEHLAECEACAAEVEAIVALGSAARSLPREIAPRRDLWEGIAVRIGAAPEATPEPAVIELASRRPARSRYTSWAPLAAAALLLVVLSSGITAALLRSGAAPRVATAPGVGGPAYRESHPNAALAAFRPAEQEYENAVASLQAQLDARRDQLAPETVEVIELNLRIIDQAIAEARAALAADPGNADLPLHLSDVYGQKVELLRSALQIAT